MKKLFFAFLLIAFCVPLIAQDPDPGPSFNIWTIVSAALAILSTIFGTIVVKVKGKVKHIVKLAREAVEAGQAGVNLIDEVTSAFDDNVVTPEEKARIKDAAAKAKTEWEQVKAQWKVLWGKAE